MVPDPQPADSGVQSPSPSDVPVSFNSLHPDRPRRAPDKGSSLDRSDRLFLGPAKRVGDEVQDPLLKADEGYSVSCPGLPGCWSQGATEDEAIENIQDAIQEYLAAVSESLRGDDVREVDIPG